MRYFFVITDYIDDIIGIQEVIPDMQEVEEKINFTKYKSILNKCKIKTIIKYSELGYFDLKNNPITASDIINYNPHEIIAWIIFNDEKWMKENPPHETEEPDYYT